MQKYQEDIVGPDELILINQLSGCYDEQDVARGERRVGGRQCVKAGRARGQVGVGRLRGGRGRTHRRVQPRAEQGGEAAGHFSHMRRGSFTGFHLRDV